MISHNKLIELIQPLRLSFLSCQNLHFHQKDRIEKGRKENSKQYVSNLSSSHMVCDSPTHHKEIPSLKKLGVSFPLDTLRKGKKGDGTLLIRTTPTKPHLFFFLFCSFSFSPPVLQISSRPAGSL